MGFSLLLYANAALQGAVIGMQRALTALRDEGTVEESKGLLVSFAERQRLVGKAHFDALGRNTPPIDRRINAVARFSLVPVADDTGIPARKSFWTGTVTG